MERIEGVGRIDRGLAGRLLGGRRLSVAGVDQVIVIEVPGVPGVPGVGGVVTGLAVLAELGVVPGRLGRTLRRALVGLGVGLGVEGPAVMWRGQRGRRG